MIHGRNRFGCFLPKEPVDAFDPRFLFDKAEPSPPSRVEIQIGQQVHLCAIVDRADVGWLSQWCWQFYLWRGSVYAKRTEYLGDGRRRSVYMHREIALHALPPPPSPAHFLVDHKDGRGLHNWRGNLRWATVSQNNANIHGSYFRQLSFP